jgi:hypothetical protein
MRGDRCDQFGSLALELFVLQFANNVPYRRFCQAEGLTPDSVQAWPQIPAMPTTAFKELELTSIPAENRTAEFWSSGTTEQRPSRHLHNANSLGIYETSLLEWGRKHLRFDGTSILSLTPPRALAPRSSLVYMFETILNHERDRRSAFVGQIDSQGGWDINITKAVALLTLCAESGEPVSVLGTAFNFVHLLDALRERELRLQLPPGSWALETGGYKGRTRALPKTELHRLLGEFLGIGPERIVCEYGMSELSSQAYDVSLVDPASQPRRFHFPPWTSVRIVSPENGHEVAEGEAGLLRVYDLANVYSVMAVETQDLAIRRGTDFELVGRAERAESRGCSLMTI